MADLNGNSIEELRALYRARAVSPRDVVRACLERIEERDGTIGAFIETVPEKALQRAADLERSGNVGRPLFGVPIAIKDNICTRGVATTAASGMLAGYTPPYDATVIRRLETAGAVIIGKTNLDEFAMGSSTENSAFRRTANPWDIRCAPGGSSGGSAAAVAAGMVPVALGSDTGGSIRQPASFCGVVGLKGTYGRVSRYGLIAFASSLDQIGPIARNVRDCAAVMQVIAGHDRRDATSLVEPSPDLLGGMESGAAGLRIAIPAAIDEWEMDESVRRIMERTVRDVRSAGAQTHEIDLPAMETSIACYYIIATAEASSNLARYDGVRYGFRARAESLTDLYERTRGEGFGEEVKRRILLGTYVLSAGYYDAYYAKAQQVRAMVRDRYRRIFDRYDLVMLPTSPTPAFRLGERTADPIAMYLSDIFTTPANIAGLPAVSVPADCTSDGRPVGIQLIAGAGREASLMRGARALEVICRFGERFPDGPPSAS
jgi:aspartyl-tRNA(Asn)/glutamyl-tRNA(Gln) amidotransferase subunit A